MNKSITTGILCLLLFVCIVFGTSSKTTNTLTHTSARNLLSLSCWPNCFKRNNKAKNQRQGSKSQPLISETHLKDSSTASIISSNPKTADENRLVIEISTTPFADVKTQSLYNIAGNTYKMIKQLGKGAFGVVFEAQQINSDQLVAIKLQDVTTKYLWESALKEWKVAPWITQYNQKSNKPNNLCPIYQMSKMAASFEELQSENIQTFAMVLPYFPSGDLKSYEDMLKQNNIPSDENRAFKEVSLLLRQIGLNALRILNNEVHINGKEIYYNDMKPHNILVELDENNFINRFVLTDYGVASTQITASGSWGYINPIGIGIHEMVEVDKKHSDLITEAEKTAMKERRIKLRDIIGINPAGITDIHGLAAVAFEYYGFRCDNVKNELCGAANAYVQFKENGQYSKIMNIRERRKLINAVVKAWDGIDVQKRSCEYKLATFFQLAFNIHESESQIENMKQLTWNYVQEVVDSLDQCT